MVSTETLDKIEKIANQIEDSSTAEVVVTLSLHSGSYRDVDMAWGALASAATLAALVGMPFSIDDAWLLPLVALAYLAAYFLSNSCQPMRNLLTSKKRRRAQVEEAARAAFYNEHVGATHERVGILFFLSLAEGELEILPDHGVDRHVPRACWHEMRLAVSGRPNIVERFTDELQRCGQMLRERMPGHAEHELETRPQVLTS